MNGSGLVRFFLCLLVLLMPAAAFAQARQATPYAERMAIELARDPAATGEAALADLRRTRDPNLRADIYWVIAQSHFLSGDPDTARQVQRQIAGLRRSGVNGRRDRARISLLDGMMAFARRDFGAALSAYRNSQLAFIRARDQRGQSQALRGMAMLYNDVGDGPSAQRFLDLAANVYNDDDLSRLIIANNRGAAAMSDERFADALRQFSLARDMASRLELRSFLPTIDRNIALAHANLGDYDAAETALARLGPIADISNPGLRLNAYRVLATIALGRGQLDRAERALGVSLSGVDPQSSASSYRQFHFLAYQLANRRGNHNRALEQLEAVRRIDQVDAVTTASNRAALLGAQFQFSAQESRIQQMRAQQLQRDIAAQRRFTYAIMAGAALALALLGALVMALFRSRNQARQHSAELSEINVELERALAAKKAFLAATSHEIRTPLNGILGVAQVMLADRNLGADHRRQMELLNDAGATMKALVDDILDAAKMDNGSFTVQPRPADVGDVMSRVARLYATQAESRGIALVIDNQMGDCWQMTDPDRLTQILFNLVGNALKFTHEGSVTVSLCRSAAGDTLDLAVRDSGIGIAAEHHDAVFEMFRQVDNSRRRTYGGTGLGLAICRQLARAMGGDIALDSVEGAGSCFTVHLPWSPAERPEAANDRGPARLAAGGVALMAGDPMRAAMLGMMAKQAGLATTIVASADVYRDGAGDPSIDWIIDGAAADVLAGYAASDGVPAGRILLVGIAEASVLPDALADPDNQRVTHCQFARSMVVAGLAEWGKGEAGLSLPVQPLADEPKETEGPEEGQISPARGVGGR